MKAQNLLGKGLLIVSSLALAVGIAPQLRAYSANGTDHGYYWGIYYTGSGSAKITFPYASTYAGNYQLDWTSGVTDAAGGKGWKPGSVRNINYNCGKISGQHSFGGYGWTQSPTIEYYITDMGANGGTYVGSVYSDGSSYSVYKQQRVSAPSPFGTQTFWQYKDSRSSSTSTGSNHTITMSNHVNYWKAHMGSGWGTVYDTILNVEAFSGPGTCNATVW